MGAGLRAAAKATREKPAGLYKIGDTITVHNNGPIGVRTIKEATPTKAIDSRGQEWSNAANGWGRPFGRERERHYMGPTIETERPGDRDVVRAKNLRLRLAAVKWADVSLDTLEAVASMLALDPAKVPA